MASFQIVIEQLFAEATSYWGILWHCPNHKLGLQQVGKLFPLGIFFLNIHTLLYGNLTSSYFGSERMLLDVTIEEYIALADL